MNVSTMNRIFKGTQYGYLLGVKGRVYACVRWHSGGAIAVHAGDTDTADFASHFDVAELARLKGAARSKCGFRVTDDEIVAFDADFEVVCKHDRVDAEDCADYRRIIDITDTEPLQRFQHICRDISRAASIVKSAARLSIGVGVRTPHICNGILNVTDGHRYHRFNRPEYSGGSWYFGNETALLLTGVIPGSELRAWGGATVVYAVGPIIVEEDALEAGNVGMVDRAHRDLLRATEGGSVVRFSPRDTLYPGLRPFTKNKEDSCRFFPTDKGLRVESTLTSGRRARPFDVEGDSVVGEDAPAHWNPAYLSDFAYSMPSNTTVTLRFPYGRTGAVAGAMIACREEKELVEYHGIMGMRVPAEEITETENEQ